MVSAIQALSRYVFVLALKFWVVVVPRRIPPRLLVQISLQSLAQIDPRLICQANRDE